MRRIVSISLILIILLTAVPFAASAESLYGEYDGLVGYLTAEIANCNASIDVKEFNITESELENAMQFIYYSNPYLFNYSYGYSYNYVVSTGRVTVVQPYYIISDADEYKSRIEFVNNELDSIVATVPKGYDEFGIAAYLSDYICLNFQYSPEGDYNNDLYSMLYDGHGICEAYARLYMALLDKCGISACLVINEEIDHSWVEFRIGDDWYMADPTWNDPVPDVSGKAYHEYFIKSSFDDHGTSYSTLSYCNDDSFDALFWHSVDKPFAFIGGRIYCIYGRDVCEFSLSGNTKKTVYHIGDTWPTANNNSYYTDCLSGLGSYGDRLLINNAKSLLELSVSDGTVKPVYTLSGNKKIYGFYINGDTAYLNIGIDASSKNIEIFAIDLAELFDAGQPIDNETVLGDLDGDGEIGAVDYVMVKRSVLGTFMLGAAQNVCADVNRDGNVDAIDYVMIKRHVLGTYKLA